MTWLTNVLTAGAGFGGMIALREYYLRGGQCTSPARLEGKTVVITGCNTGIGKETALDLSRRGARVVMACRNLEKAEQAADDIRGRVEEAQIAIYKCDLSSQRSVRSCAEEILDNEGRVDVLINNGGVMMCPFTKTEDGHEMQIGTNHLGHFLLTNLLLDKLKESAPSRVVTVSSRAHTRGTIDLDDLSSERKRYSRFGAYAQSKLANVLFTRELARRLRGTGVTTYAVHPGVVFTDLFRHVESSIGPLKYVLNLPLCFFMKSCRDGAQTTIHCAVAEELARESGKYYSDCAEVEPSTEAKDDAIAKDLWDVSAKAVGMA